MPQFSGLAVCSITHLEWEDYCGKYFKGILMTPIAGKIPSRRILYTPFFPELDKSKEGEYFLMSFYEIKLHAKLGRRFQWTSIPNTQKSDFQLLIKELGPAAIINVESKGSLPTDSLDWLVKEKLRYETEIKYFKAKAHSRHLEKEKKSFETPSDNYDNGTTTYDNHNIHIAFDGDVNSINEFLGNY